MLFSFTYVYNCNVTFCICIDRHYVVMGNELYVLKPNKELLLHKSRFGFLLIGIETTPLTQFRSDIN